MCSDSARPRAVRFQDVTEHVEHELPAWLSGGGYGLEPTMAPLHSPELPRLPRPALAPRIESLRPAASQRPSRPPGPSSQPLGARQPSLHGALFEPGASAPPGASPSQPAPPLEGLDPGFSSGARERRRDTLIEDLVPRAEEEAVLAIKAALEAFTAARQAQLAGAERELIELVRVICRRVVLREVSLSHATLEALVREGLGALGSGDRVSVKLGAFFADALDHIQDNLQHQGIECGVVIDPALPAHGCVVETELGRVDESVETRLAVLLANLDATG